MFSHILIDLKVFIITARKRSCGKVMFLHLSMILFTGKGGRGSVQEGLGAGVSVGGGGFFQGSPCPGGWSLSRRSPPGEGEGSLSKGLYPGGSLSDPKTGQGCRNIGVQCIMGNGLMEYTPVKILLSRYFVRWS